MSETNRSTGRLCLLAFFVFTTSLIDTARGEVCAKVTSPLLLMQGLAAASTIKAVPVSQAGYDGAPFGLNELAGFYQYPRQGNRPLVTFGGPVPLSKRAVKADVPKRQIQTGLRVPPRARSGSGKIRAPQPVPFAAPTTP